jgi:predicted lipid-binding transport protein (Tim44 family)
MHVDLLILLLLSLFLGFRVWETLGKRAENQPGKAGGRPSVIPQNQVVVEKEAAPKRDTSFYDGFDESVFLEGAEQAFKLIQRALRESTPHTLKKFVASDCLKALLEKSPWTGKKEGEVCLLSLSTQNKRREKDRAKVDVLICYQQNLSGKLENMSEVWTFTRQVTSSNPNWTLIETQLT